MNLNELKAALQVYYDNYNNIGVSVYAILKDIDNGIPVRLDIEAVALDGLKRIFIDGLREEISQQDELPILNLSSSDERSNAIYIYDLDVPPELTLLEAVVSRDDLPLLNLNDRGLASIKALLIEIGNNAGQMVLYKTMAPVNIFGRDGFFLIKSNTRLKKLDDEFLRISAGFQFFRINGTLLIIDLKALERNFGFHEIIKREAALGVSAIEQASLTVNPEVLHELLDDVKYARKLTRVANASPVLLAGISGARIVQFCRTFPKLAGKIRFNDAQDKIILDTKISKDLFIQLLMDNFLTSELTKYHYASLAKDHIDQEAE